jgi:hypothetical protein
MFFSGGGEEELQGTTAETFSQDDASSKQPCFIYYILRSGFFRCNMSSGHREDGEGVVAPLSATDSTEQWV